MDERRRTRGSLECYYVKRTDRVYRFYENVCGAAAFALAKTQAATYGFRRVSGRVNRHCTELSPVSAGSPPRQDLSALRSHTGTQTRETASHSALRSGSLSLTRERTRSALTSLALSIRRHSTRRLKGHHPPTISLLRTCVRNRGVTLTSKPETKRAVLR